jgi:hypothetical protein
MDHRPIFPPELADFMGRRKLAREGVTFIGWRTEPAEGTDRAFRMSSFPHPAAPAAPEQPMWGRSLLAKLRGLTAPNPRRNPRR